MSKSETKEIEAYLNDVSEDSLAGLSSEALLTDEEDEHSALIVPREYQSAITTFESPLMEYNSQFTGQDCENPQRNFLYQQHLYADAWEHYRPPRPIERGRRQTTTVRSARPSGPEREKGKKSDKLRHGCDRAGKQNKF